MGIKFGGLIGSVTTPTALSGAGIWDVRDVYGSKFLSAWPAYTIPFTGLVATGGTLTTGNSYNQWAFTSSSTWTVTSPGIAYYAIVAGGGGGGSGIGGGGGAGGVITGILLANAGTYSVVIGGGGVGSSSSTVNGTNGAMTYLGTLSAVGGGGGGTDTGSPTDINGGILPFGGSGGGTRAKGENIMARSQAIAGQGWAGGVNQTPSPNPSGGGGGAGGQGQDAPSSTVSGGGGIGISIYLPASGVSTYVGGGGGGGHRSGYTAGTGGTGGGGNGGSGTAGTAGTTNTGGGGGGGGTNNGASGGSGVVYIWAPSVNTTKTPYVQYLAVAGGGGAGGLLTGTTTVSAGVTYTVQVGAGGTASAAGSYPIYGNGGNGGNSSISGTGLTTITAVGGGGGMAATTGPAGVAGGSGGGGAGGTEPSGGAGTTGQGYTGGSSNSGSPNNLAGGGGGFGMIGANGASSLGTGTGNGGDGGTFGIANGTGQNWSNKFNGSNYLYTSSIPSMSVGTGNFTVECWFYSTAAFGNNGLFHISSTAGGVPSSTGGIAIGLQPSQINYYNNGTNTAVSYTTPINQWNHIAIVRSGSTGTLYLNGSSLTTVSDSTNYSTTYAAVGAYFSSSYLFSNGYISNFRVVVGTALYTGSTYTVPTNGLSAISGTQLLTCQSPAFVDSSSNGATITTSSSPYITSQNPFGITYAGGGGAAIYSGKNGYGGMGGGGTGGNNGGTATGTAAVANTGSGGGGGSSSGSSAGGSGGSGIVVLSYPSSYPVAASTTGSPSLTAINGNNIYKFTATGSITF